MQGKFQINSNAFNMKYLFYGGSSITMPHMGVLLNEALVLNEKGGEIIWAYCNAKCQSCISNMSSNSMICKNCRNRTHRLLNNYSNKFTIIGLFDKKKIAREYEKEFVFNNIKELQNFTYKNCNLGYSIASAYISATRNSVMSFSERHKTFYSKLALFTVERMDNFENIVKECRPDCIVVFNGRNFDTAICVEIAKKYNIDFQIKEVLDGPRCAKPFFIETFFNYSAFDVKYKTERIEEVWSESLLSEEEKNLIGLKFYEQKRGGGSITDKSYVKEQKIGLLPQKWNSQKKNVVIFNSSDDELTSIGADYNRYSLFKSQYRGICSILEYFKGNIDIDFYLRMHPNLANIDTPFINELLELSSKFDNITIIKPEEKISTYSLLDCADTVISFGSTMGVEANYWGKPSILLSASEYYNLGVCYVPSDTKSLYEMIKSELLPLDKRGAIKYAFYLLEREVRCHKSKLVDISFTKRNLFSKIIYTFSYDKLFHSSVLSRLESLIYRKILSKFISDRNLFPDHIILDNI